jgi:hypothetical protein
VESIRIVATATHPNATVTDTGVFALNFGQNIFDIKVVAEDTAVAKIYTVSVFRQSRPTAVASTKQSSIVLYPNPTTGLVYIRSELAVEEVKVYSLIGRLLLKTNQQPVDLSRFGSGIYLIEVNGVRSKIVVIR